jgi:hypothetical protein
LVEVVEGVLGYLRAGGAAEEECCFGVLDGFWGFLVEGSFAARVAGFSGISQFSVELKRLGGYRYIWRNIFALWWENWKE